MEDDRQVIQELLDGELSPEERKVFLDRLNSDPLLKREFEDLRNLVDMVETSERLSVPPSFASEVMKKLPVPKISFTKRVSGFFFGQRVLRWNMAAALATVSLVMVIIGGFFYTQKQTTLAPVTSPLYLKQAASMVRMSFYAPQAKTVAVAGDFNKWSEVEGVMKRQDGGIWTIEVPLNPGVYHYMFVLDGEVWVPDPQAESYRDDGFGNRNSVLRVSL